MTDHSAPNAPDLRDLIDQLTGDSTPEQQERIRQWSAGDHVKQAWIDGLRDVVQMASDDDARRSLVNMDAVRAGVFAEIARGQKSNGEQLRGQQRHDQKSHGEHSHAKPLDHVQLLGDQLHGEHVSGEPRASSQNLNAGKPTRYTFKSVKYVVGFAVVLLAAVLLPRAWNSSSDSFATHAANEYVTAKAQWINLVLPDGSQVVLGPESKLRYTTTSSGERIVDLQGQSYFTVTHDPAKPFTVRTHASVTRVLGTQFSVRSYAEDKEVLVGVAEGRVSIGVENPTVILAAGDVGRVTPNGDPKVLHDVNTAAVFGWMNGQFVYEDIPLEQLAADLERYYGVTVEITDHQAKKRPITAAFQRGSVSSVIKAIAMASDLKVIQNGNKIVFSSMSSRHGSSIDSSFNPSNTK